MAHIRKLITLCMNGDFIPIQEFIERLRNSEVDIKELINTPTFSGETVLITACKHGKEMVVRYLVDECGADVELTGTVNFDGEAVEGVTPLWCASAAAHLRIVIFLLSRGADINRTTITNSTALRAACFDGHFEVVRYLVEHGAEIETPNRHEHTCLMIACFRGHERIAKYLISRGARVNRRSAKGNTALHDCAESGNTRALGLLFCYGAVMRPDEHGLTPILSGANSAYKSVVDFLSEMKSPQTGEPIVPIEEQVAARELLGASLYDRHLRLRDAVAEWQTALHLRLRHLGYTKRLPPPPAPGSDLRNHFAWRLVSSAADYAVTMEAERARRARRWDRFGRLTDRDELRRSYALRLAPPPPSAFTSADFWNDRFESRCRRVQRRYIELMRRTEFSARKESEALRSVVDAVLNVPPMALPKYLRHFHRPLGGEPEDRVYGISDTQSPNYTERYFTVPNNWITRGTDNPCSIFAAAESELVKEAEAAGEEDPRDSPTYRLMRASLTAFGHVREFATFEELEAVAQDFHALPLQSLLIRLRILGPDHPDTIYFLRYRGATCADGGWLAQCFGCWRYALELQRVFLEPLSYVGQSSFLALAELFNIILSNRYTGLRSCRLEPDLILDALAMAIDNIERGAEFSYPAWAGRTPWAYTNADKEATNLHRHFRLALHFVALLAFYFCPLDAHPPMLELRRRRWEWLKERERALVFTGEPPLHTTLMELSHTPAHWLDIPTPTEHAEMRERFAKSGGVDRFFRLVNRLVRLDIRVQSGSSLLHVGVSFPSETQKSRADLLPLPHEDVLRLLCAVGAPPDALDARGYRPLGRVLSAVGLSDFSKARLVAALVLHCGAHLDAAVMPPQQSLEIVEATAGEVDHSSSSDLEVFIPAEVPRYVFPGSFAEVAAQPMTPEDFVWPFGRAYRKILSLAEVKPLQHISLQCLAARAIPPERMAEVPEHLAEFVRLHHFQPPGASGWWW